MRNLNKFLVGIMIVGLTLWGMSGSGFAAGYPSKPITLIVPYSAGGGGDTTSRLIADVAGEIMGVKFIVVNKTGGGATIGIGAVAKSKPDGYTIGFISTSPITIRVHMMKAPYNPMKDLTYLGQFISSYMPIIVRTESPWKTLDELMQYAKNNPGKLRWSTAVQRGGPHVAVESMFKQDGAKATFIPSKGGAKVLANLLGKTIDMAAVSEFSVPFASGEVRVLAETTPNRNPVAPDKPIITEVGYPFAPAIFFGLAGPAGLSKEVTDKWDVVLKQVVESAKFQELAKRRKYVPSYSGSAAFTKKVHDDYKTAGEVLKKIGMK